VAFLTWWRRLVKGARHTRQDMALVMMGNTHLNSSIAIGRGEVLVDDFQKELTSHKT
jgi:hypothetical protein